MSFGGSNQSGSQRSEPWTAQQPYLKDVYQRGQGWLEGRTPLSGTQGLEQGLFDRALANADGSPLEQTAANTIGSFAAGSNPWQQGIASAGETANPFTGAILQAGNRGNPLVDDIAGAGAVANPFIGDVAQYGRGNPWLDRTFEQASEKVGDRFLNDVLPGINATFGSAGRTGSGLHAGAFGDVTRNYGDTLNNLATDIYGGAYEADAGRRLNRDLALGQLGESGLNRLLSGTTTAAGFLGDDLNRSLQGATTAAGFRDSDLNRGLHAAEIGSRNALDATRQVPGIEGLMDRNTSELYGYTNQGLKDLQAYKGLIDPAIIQSMGGSSGSSANFGLK